MIRRIEVASLEELKKVLKIFKWDGKMILATVRTVAGGFRITIQHCVDPSIAFILSGPPEIVTSFANWADDHNIQLVDVIVNQLIFNAPRPNIEEL